MWTSNEAIIIYNCITTVAMSFKIWKSEMIHINRNPFYTLLFILTHMAQINFWIENTNEKLSFFIYLLYSKTTASWLCFFRPNLIEFFPDVVQRAGHLRDVWLDLLHTQLMVWLYFLSAVYEKPLYIKLTPPRLLRTNVSLSSSQIPYWMGFLSFKTVSEILKH